MGGADLGRFAKVALMDAPTPLERLPRLGEELGVDLWIKRDDLGATGLGGNKLRKLEYLLGDAIDRGCDTVVTFGAVQSNHARQTAAAAARLGLRCHLLLTQSVDRADDLYSLGGNRLLDDLFGAETIVCEPDDLDAALVELDAALASSGADAAWISPGGSEPVGVLGYVAAARELSAQLEAASLRAGDVVVATSTGGTHAGLLQGLGTGSDAPVVRGVAVYNGVEETTEAVALLAAGAAELLGEDAVDEGAVDLDGSQLGPGYGIPTDASREATALFARSEGIVLDPVYTAKAAASLVQRCRARKDRASGFGDAAVVFVHTGGAPGLFAYGDDALPR